MTDHPSAQSRVEAAYAAMDRDNTRINAVLDVFNQTAILEMLDADERIENDRARSPVDGMPIGVKANIGVEGQFLHGGIKAYAAERATADSEAVRRLRAAGAVVTGTLNMEEGALGAQTDNPWFGRTLNPLRDGHTPGGSSGGSAAAVAAGFCEAALGTDTMGSVRIPSAYCGLWGFKPSHDTALLDGVMPLSPTLDTVGVHAADLDTLVAVTEVLLARGLGGGAASDMHLLDWGDSVECEPGVAEVFAAFADRLSLTKTDLGSYAYGRSRRAGLILSEVEGHAVHAEMLARDPDGFSDTFRSLLEYGRDVPDEKVRSARNHVRALRQEAADLPDFIMMPTAPQTAFPFGSEVPANQADFTAYANLADRPAIQFPVGEAANGLPVGAQVVGPRGREADLVATVRRLFS